MSGRALIVGGGVIGTACSYFLTRAGWSVTLIERNRSGEGASTGNCGLICPSHVLPLAEPGVIGSTLKAMFRKNSPFAVRIRPDPALWSWLLRFALRCNKRDMLESARGIQALLGSSLSLYDTVIPKEALACEWERNGLLYVYRSPEAMRAYESTDRLLTEVFHEPSTRLDGDSVAELEPALKTGLAGGYHYEHDSQLRPDRLLASWRALLESEGVRFIEECALEAFEPASGPARSAKTSKRDFEADAFVVATGALTPRLKSVLGCKVPVQPGKGYSLTMPRPAVCPRIPLIFPETRVAVSPFQSGYRLGSTMEFAGYDESIRPERIQLLRDGASPYLREPYSDVVEQEWAGWRPMTYDGLPIIDRIPGRENVWMAAGHNMLGMSMAPATGKLVAEMLSGQTPHLDPAPYRITRFG